MSVTVGGIVFQASADGSIYGKFKDGDAPVTSDRGLYWADGIEPTDTTLYPLAGGKRIWYVDLDAGVDGDGDEGTPLNNFTDLIGYWSGGSYTVGTLGFAGGDQIWITGTGTAAKHTLGVSDMRIDMRRDLQFGSITEPTVIRSWKGQSRALFDGNFTDSLGIHAKGQTSLGNGLVILNIAGTGNTVDSDQDASCAIHIDDNVQFARIESCYAYFNQAIAGGPSTNYCGILARCSNGLRDVKVNNNLTHNNNTTNGTTVQDSHNIGEISLLTQASADSASVVEFFKNVIHDGNYAVRHKHSGDHIFNSYDNKIDDCVLGHYIRNAGTTTIHDNDITNCPGDVQLESESQSQRRPIDIYNNTWVNVDEVIATEENPETLQSTVDWYDNTLSNPTFAGPVFVMGRYAGSGADASEITGHDNVIDILNDSNFWRVNGSDTDLANYAAATGDTTTVVT